jgi:Leucine-rich repeat (LRR) protein
MMRIKIDECLPAELVGILNEIGHISETVKDEGLSGNQINDLAPLLDLRQLKTINLKGNPLPEDQIDALKKAMPELEIDW